MTVERTQDIIDRMLQGKYTGIKVGFICDRITWLWKWKKIDEDTMSKMTSQVCDIIRMGFYD